MAFHPDQHHRRSIRLAGYDYSAPGAYFVTLCVARRRCVFGEIADGEIRLSDAGRIVTEVWASLPVRFSAVELDSLIVMPNHLHATIFLVGARFIAPTARAAQDTGPRPHPDARNRGVPPAGLRGAEAAGAMNRAPTGAVALGEVVRTFKAVTARRIRSEMDPSFAWQRNYFEHVLRSEERLGAARRYIAGNPAAWAGDPERPQ